MDKIIEEEDKNEISDEEFSGSCIEQLFGNLLINNEYLERCNNDLIGNLFGNEYKCDYTIFDDYLKRKKQAKEIQDRDFILTKMVE